MFAGSGRASRVEFAAVGTNPFVLPVPVSGAVVAAEMGSFQVWTN